MSSLYKSGATLLNFQYIFLVSVCVTILQIDDLWYNKIILSWTYMVNEATFRETLATYQPDDGRRISQNLASLNIFVYDVINLIYYKHWKNNRNNFKFCLKTFQTSITFQQSKSSTCRLTLRKKSPYSELFWSVFFPRIRITPNTDYFYAV